MLRAAPYYVDQLSIAATLPGRPAVYGEPAPPLTAPLAAALSARGIDRLYAHQATAIDAARRGRHVVISTATSSGKSFTFTLPVCEAALADAAAVALYLFPTKALAQDQLRALTEFIATSASLTAAVRPAVLDGDTGWDERARVQETANVLLTNPDLLHVTLLPHHARWRRVWSGLRYVILDEAHAYRGVFGSHVALILRRLLRIAAHYGATPTFIVCSATIANPLAHFRALVPPWGLAAATGGAPAPPDISADADDGVCLIGADADGAATGARKFLLWNPPLRVGGPAAASAAAVEQPAVDEVSDTDSADERRPAAAASHLPPARDRAAIQRAVVDRALSARFAVPSLARPTAYRRDATAAPYGMQRAAAAVSDGAAPLDAAVEAPKPRWLQRWLEHAAAGGGAAARRSPVVEAAALLTTLVCGGMRTIVFCRVRKVAELLLQYTHERLAGMASSGGGGALALIPRVKSYRAGYLKEHRRAIERDLFGGKLLGVVATNALELGVDIGSLDAVVMLGYPGSSASLWQQAGRAGRGGRAAVAIMVAYDNAIDQHFVAHPHTLLARPPEAALVDAANPNLLRVHALCAAAELPLQPAEVALFGTGLGDVVAGLRREGSLLPARIAVVTPAPPAAELLAFQTAPWVAKPAKHVNIRAIDDVVYKVRAARCYAVLYLLMHARTHAHTNEKCAGGG